MEKMNIALLKKLSEADGISGYEDEVAHIMKEELSSYADEIVMDRLKSVIALQKGTTSKHKIMIAAHMDEVGFIVKKIDQQGYVYMQNVGGWWAHVLPSNMLSITTNTGRKIKGVVGSRAPHGLSKHEKETVMSLDSLYLDLGVNSEAEVLALGVKIGDMITPDTQFMQMNDSDYFLGKAFDDRACLFIVMEVLKNLQTKTHAADIYAVGSVQEEVGLRGARTTTYQVHPDIAIALDTCAAMDTPFDHSGIQLGEGPVLTLMDSMAIAHKGLLLEIEKICQQLNISLRYAYNKHGGTDNGNIHKTYDGIISMTIAIPTRYMHSHRLIVHKQDIMQTIALLTKFCELCHDDMIENLQTYHQ